MKKIMFNDQYGLTQAVLDGRKTQTRRILNPTMLFERLDTYEGWTKESIADWKESCKDQIHFYLISRYFYVSFETIYNLIYIT